MGAAGRIVVVGDLMTDVVVCLARPLRHGTDTPGTVRSVGGGSAANTAHWLAATGTPVAYVGRVGDDPLGAAATATLQSAGVDVRAMRDPARPTGTCVVLVDTDGERDMVPDPGANLGLAAADLPADLLRPGDHLHLSGYPLLREATRDAAQEMLRRARAAGLTTSVDAASAGPIQDVGAPLLRRLLAGTDVLLANGDEAVALAAGAAEDPLAAAAALARELGALVVVKRGVAGAAALRPGAAPVTVPAEPAAVVDSTGAGDAFAAGFLPALLSGAPLAEALAAGARLAARALARAGARP